MARIAFSGHFAKKLYFDIALRLTQVQQSEACTPFRAGLNGDRFGSLLQPVESCAATSNAPQTTAEARECSAWFKPSGTGSTACAVNVFFSAPTVGAGTPTVLPAYGGIAAGDSAVFGTVGMMRQFSVTVKKPVGIVTTAVVVGTVYVARQHSIEV
jgi:hypothetical protein